MIFGLRTRTFLQFGTRKFRSFSCRYLSNPSLSAKMQVGDEAPTFQLPDQNGNEIALESFRDKKNVVLYFYPKDNTTGCTMQACSFRDSMTQFNSLDAESECYQTLLLSVESCGMPKLKKRSPRCQ